MVGPSPAGLVRPIGIPVLCTGACRREIVHHGGEPLCRCRSLCIPREEVLDMPWGDRLVRRILILLGIVGLGALAVPLCWTAMYAWGLSQQPVATLPPEKRRQQAELVCHEVDPDVVARIEASLTLPAGGHLRGVRSVNLAVDQSLWFIAADVQGVGYEGDSDIGVWRIKDHGTNSPGRFEACDPLSAVNDLAAEVSTLPLNATYQTHRVPALNCTTAALRDE
jgi:hypothetical protein